MIHLAYRLGIAFSIVLALTQPSFAYLDPGTGSIVLQAVMGTVACALVLGRSYLFRIKQWFQQSAARVRSVGRRAQ